MLSKARALKAIRSLKSSQKHTTEKFYSVRPNFLRIKDIRGLWPLYKENFRALWSNFLTEHLDRI